MKKPINELSLLPNLGIGGVQRTTGTTGTGTTGMNTPGSKTQAIAKSTALLTKQINDITNKIASAKQKAAQSGQGDQQKLVQTIGLLQKQLQTLTTSENEENNFKKKAVKGYKAVANMTGQAIGARTGVPGAGAALGKMGEYTAGKMSKFLGLEGKKSKSIDINNNKDMRVSKSKKIEEGLLPAVGKAASTAVKTVGNVAGMIPVVGGPVKAAADLAGDVTTGVLGGEDEESSGQLTPIQDEVVNALARKRYHINKVSHQYAEEEGGPTVYMSKRPNKYSTRYASVAPDGSVNGMPLKEFFGSEENEERVLTKKQQMIAKAAPPHDKITGADFAALNKESKETKNFLKAVLQKNYSEANKYLGILVNEKLKKVISKATDIKK